jgi:hypothetical protein
MANQWALADTAPPPVVPLSGRHGAADPRVRRAIGWAVNRWGIPDWLEREVKDRDKTCVYCGTQMNEQLLPSGPRKAVATWEHIINDSNIVTRESIARCCVACNSSKGTMKLSDWLQSGYCKKRGINKDTVAEIVKEALRVDA